MSELTTQLPSDLPTITAEINAYKRVAGEAIFEIGRRLKHVKENDLAHGQWERWCREEIEMTPQHANKFIRVSERFGNRTSTFALGIDMLALLVNESDEFVSKPHTIPSTGAEKTVDEMTVRELREVKAALKEARERCDEERAARIKAEEDYDTIRDTLDAVAGQPHVESPPQAYATNTQDVTATVISFSRGVRDFARRFSYLAQYSANLARLDGVTAQEYAEALTALRDFVRSLPETNRQRGGVVIDVN